MAAFKDFSEDIDCGMSNFVRRLVSGNKTRFRDHELDIELDLVYVTDHIIIMGFPAAGVEGLYRNRRTDAKRFLEHRHGKNFWVYNFCPLRENSYPPELFDGRVSRYPFPDHHAPPLAILPLVAREIREWLSSSGERVAVLHCKAGKGRSGTLACAYLMSLDESASPPRLARSLTKKEWAKRLADKHMERVVTDDMSDFVQIDEDGEIINEITEGVLDEDYSPITSPRPDVPKILVKEPTADSPQALTPIQTNDGGDRSRTPAGNSLHDVLAFHTSRRMKTPSSPFKETKQGVSIPSQRRWLSYWSLLLAHAEPPNFWSLNPSVIKPKVRLLEIKIRLREVTGLKMGLLKVVNNVLASTKKSDAPDRGSLPLWVSLARYDDDFVTLLEDWEKHTRETDGNLGKRRAGSDHKNEDQLEHLFKGGKWDRSKMIRSFARLGHIDGEVIDKEPIDKGGQVATYTLKPLSDVKWKAMKDEIEEGNSGVEDNRLQPKDLVPSTSSSIMDLVAIVEDDDRSQGIILDAEREVRIKLYMGQIFMGWLWFIPAFHMSMNEGSSNRAGAITHFIFPQKEIDFAIGIGTSLIDVDIAMEWVSSASVDAKAEPQPTQTSLDSTRGDGIEPSAGGVLAGLQNAFEGTSESARTVAEAAEATKQ